MNYITTTQLRTETTELITALMYGQSIDLVHRSQIVGQIIPKTTKKPKLFSATRIEKIVNSMNLKPVNSKDAKKMYIKHLIEKYG